MGTKKGSRSSWAPSHSSEQARGKPESRSNPILLSPQAWTCCHLAEPCMEGERSPSSEELARDSPFSWAQHPSSSLADPEWFGDEHIQAKRARVETIIQGMCVSPNPLVPGNDQTRNSPCCPEKARERKRKQSLPIQQGPVRPGSAQHQGTRMGNPRVREQLHLLKQQLRYLQEHILQAAKPRAPAQGLGGTLGAQQENGCSSCPWAAGSDQHQGSNRYFCGAETHKVAEDGQQSEEPRYLPSAAQALLEILRKEVIRVVAQAVDTVFQKVLMDLPESRTQQSTSIQGPAAERSEQIPSGGGNYKDPLAPASLPRRAQPQAGIPLENSSLTKSVDSPKYPISPGRAPKPYQGSPPNCPFTVPSCIQENKAYNQLLGYGRNGHWSHGRPQDSSSQSLPSPESSLHPWVLNQHHLPLPFMAHLESRPFPPSVKMEQSGLQAVTDTLPFSSIHIQEGLNPGHLKKAKLMFFYTRYPSSNLLKVYFPDVQFNRCITSQMIKWFSNFREFYYIQTEKFARQAISDGVTNTKMLVVLRDSELFRALNMHYNKGNDLEVPDCFLEVTSLTLQEFFRAVTAGKDSDPSWKKPIYKIISKLDSDIPEIFKSPSYPQERFQN
ncbi:LOW QUALITY PROTEIN: prospero homeobox protein 2 [Perognathus longimembris pacificus]|uniref:LOW QUALITY PROTEIN: prospero homeobox protein 2 n=1 Tax=Perognathus longimembris pacificus TaxID=214514 RepID=UPI0020184D72|nr:LOW QUALITY PROTEIN: prospero homeobox protein 2 [Perognathus longimembris pacificus]